MVPFTLIVFSKPPLGVCSRLAAEATRVLVLIRNVGFDARYARATPDHSRIVIRIPKDAEKDRGEIRLLFGWAKGLQSHRRRFVGGASAHLSEGDFGRAVEQLTKAVSLGGHQVFVADLASACSLAGKDDEAAAMLHQLLELRRQHCVPAICLARVYSRIGDSARAIEWLETAFAERNGEMVFLREEIAGAAEGDPFRRLADEPRVTALLERTNLP